MALLIIMMENYKTIATMKKMFRNLMFVAVAAMAFVACQNDTDGVNVTPEQDTITMTFVADAPESRTSIAIDGDVATYSWSSDDKIGFYYVDTDATGKKKKNSKTISIDGRTATFTAEFEALEGATNYNIGAFYPGNSWDKHSDTEAFNNVIVKIAAAQSLTENTFDPKADLMMSKPFMNVALENDSVKSLEFTRIAAIGKMNLKLDGMVANEVIKKVKFSLAEDAQFNGVVILDLENSTYTLSEEGAANYVELTGELVANADRTAIFFTCFPGEYVGAYTIEVETDKASYSKEGTLNNALTFTAGNVLNFDATVGNRKESDIKIYTKLTNANLADYSGTYLLVYEAGNVAFNGSLTTLDATNNHHAVVIDNGTITGAYSASTFTIAKVGDGYSIQSASGKYIGRSATSNGLNSADSYSVEYLNTIENLVIKGKGGNALQYNATSGQERFRYFKTTQKAIALYRQNGTGSDEEIELVQLSMPTDLKAEANGNVVTVTWDAVENAETYKNSKIDTIMMGKSAYKHYIEYLRTNNVRVESMTKEITGGFKAIDYAFGNRNIDVVYDQFIPDDEAWCVESGALELHTQEWDFADLQGGGIFNLMENSSVYRALLANYGDLICTNPGGCVRIINCA